MDFSVIARLGKGGFKQSLRPYRARLANKVAVFGLDSEYVPWEGKGSELICWQMASDNEVALTKKKLSIKNIYDQATLMNKDEHAETYVFVVYFSLAEIQFFNLDEWEISEFKGKYSLRQTYDGKKLMLADLATWYPMQGLAKVAKLWGFEKFEYPIGEKVDAIQAGESTIKELLADREFLDYAKHDAVITQQIYVKMREYFFRYGVDIVNTMTPAQTSACMFRQTLEEPIEQRDTALRKLALQACWGGRMECITRGEREQVYEYDATGHHPNSAIALRYFPEETDWIRTEKLSKWVSGISGVGKVYFKFPATEKFPCLPVYHKMAKSYALLFPLEGISYCTVSEVRLALEKGAKVILDHGFYYLKGTEVLTVHLQRLQDIRNKTEDSALRQLLKLLSNSIIGKLFQKRVGIDLGLVQKYADEHNIPMEEAIKLDGVDFGAGKVQIGSCFYPEWYALILGYARATISRQASKHDALVISSDSFVVEKELEKEFSAEGITYRLKASGTYVAYRTRFYRVGDKLAHHAVHNNSASTDILGFFHDETCFKYTHRRMLHLRESWRCKLPFGANVFRPMTVFLDYDYKRKLLEDGSTLPWSNTEELDEFLSTHEWKGENDGSDKEASSGNTENLASGSSKAD